MTFNSPNSPKFTLTKMLHYTAYIVEFLDILTVFAMLQVNNEPAVLADYNLKMCKSICSNIKCRPYLVVPDLF